jgi:probable HAF family extracellular repeat protein
MTAPTDINDAGQIVGVYVTSDGILRSFLFENGNFTTIEVPFPNAVFTEISGLNNRGQIVGRYVKSNPIDPLNPFLSHGFIATPERSPKSESKLVVSNVNNLSNAIKWPQNIKELGHPLAKWRRLLR